MIPVSLTLRGLYSYQKEATINFSELTSAGLFGIFGAVGSGKSSILEAITFALYGETERLNSRDSRSYNMMNLKCNDLLIDFVFESGSNNDKYRFTVGCKRNKKTFTDAGSFDRKGYTWTEGTWVPTHLTALDILGLSYENFKRTIIIPQGKFQEFLQLKEADRVQMLKEIFNLDKFELGPKVGRLSKENDLKISNIEGQMTSLPAYDEALLKQKEEEISQLQKQYEDLSKSLTVKQKEEKDLSDLKTLSTDLELKKKSYDLLFHQKEQNDLKQKQLEEFDNCQRVFKNLFESRNKHIIGNKRIEKELEIAKSEFESLHKKVTADEVLLNSITGSYQNRETLLQQANELEKIIRIKAITESLTVLSGRLLNGEDLITKEVDKLEKLKEGQSILKTQIETFDNSVIDSSVLLSLSNWFTIRKALTEEADRYLKEEQEAAKRLPVIQNKINVEVNNFANTSGLKINSTDFEQVKFEVEKLDKEFDEKVNKLNANFNHLQVSKRLGEFVSNLQEDTPCILCGSTHHPHILSVENVDEEIQEIVKEQKEIQQVKVKAQSTILSLSTLYSNLKNEEISILEKQQQTKRARQKLQEHESSFSFANYTIANEALVKQQLEDYQLIQSKLAALRKELTQQENDIETVTKNIEKFKQGLEALVIEKSKSSAEKETLSQQVIIYNIKNEINKSVNELNASITSNKKSYNDIKVQFETLQQTLQTNKSTLSGHAAKIGELEKQASLIVIELQEVTAAINKSLQEQTYKDEDQVNKILQQNLDIKKEKELLDKFVLQLNTAKQQLDEAKARLEGKQYNEQLHTLIQNELMQMELTLKQLTESSATHRSNFTLLKEQMYNRQALEIELEQLILRAANLKVLTNLFRSSGFVNYVSSVYLQNLVNTANERFSKMTKQKLQLELNEDNAFQVRDFLNNGQVRSIKTLSGGQTFQAALSLALALADNIQHLTKSKQNFFFLDEGFGSLDRDSLLVVFETLKNLKKENRVVGVISHVDELQQEIMVNLKVINDPEKGSYLKESWASN